MKKQITVIALSLSSILTISLSAPADTKTTPAPSSKAKADEKPQTTPEAQKASEAVAPAKPATASTDKIAENTTGPTKSPTKDEDPTKSKDNKDADSASDADKATTPIDKITDEVDPELDRKAKEEAAKEHKDDKPYKPVVFKDFDRLLGEKLIPTSYRRVWEKAGLPRRAIDNVLSFLLDPESNISAIDNERMVIIDFTQPSTQQRLYILNLKTGAFAQRFAAHGKKSGNLFASDFSKSNLLNSLQTTIGFHVFAEVYDGKHGKSYRIDGLEERNSNARERDIVVHGAMYATTDFVEMRKKQGAYVRLGLSYGCPAVSPNTMELLLDLHLSKALLYNYTALDSDVKVLKIK